MEWAFDEGVKVNHPTFYLSFLMVKKEALYA